MRTTDLDDLLHIPDFLRRADWTEEDHRRAEEEHKQIEAQLRRRNTLQEQLITKKAEEARCEKDKALEVKRQRQITREQAAGRSLTKKQERADIIDLIDRHFDTHGQIVKATGLDGQRISNHLRFLLNHGKIRKASQRRYTTI